MARQPVRAWHRLVPFWDNLLSLNPCDLLSVASTRRRRLSRPLHAQKKRPTHLTLEDLESRELLTTVQFEASTFFATEGATKTIAVTLDAPAPANGVTVQWATSNGSATAGSDYLAASGLLTIPEGQSSASFTVTIADDAVAEFAETVNLTLSSPTNAVLGARPEALLTITDNDLGAYGDNFTQSNGSSLNASAWSTVQGSFSVQEM